MNLRFLTIGLGCLALFGWFGSSLADAPKSATGTPPDPGASIRQALAACPFLPPAETNSGERAPSETVVFEDLLVMGYDWVERPVSGCTVSWKGKLRPGQGSLELHVTRLASIDQVETYVCDFREANGAKRVERNLSGRALDIRIWQLQLLSGEELKPTRQCNLKASKGPYVIQAHYTFDRPSEEHFVFLEDLLRDLLLRLN